MPQYRYKGVVYMAQRRSNGEGTIRERRPGQFVGQIMLGYKENGKPNRVTVYGTTKREVGEKLRQLATQKYEGRYIQRKLITYKTWVLKWFYNYKLLKLKPRTADNYESMINTHIIPGIGEPYLSDLEPDQIQRFYNKLYNCGLGLSPATIRKIHNIVYASLKRAVINGLLLKNPAEDLELPEIETPKIKAFNETEETIFLNAAKSSYCYDAFLMGFDTGLRMGELLAIYWSDIDLKVGIVSVHCNLMVVKNRDKKSGEPNYKLIIQDRPKTKASVRKVPLTARVIKMLKIRKLKAEDPEGLVFPSIVGTFINPRNFERSFKNICKKAKLEECNVHTMRHTFATKCFKAGIPIKIIMKWLGHSRISHTMDIYTHVLPDLEKDAIKLLDCNLDCNKSNFI